jgi:hypothetical protein
MGEYAYYPGRDRVLCFNIGASTPYASPDDTQRARVGAGAASDQVSDHSVPLPCELIR